MQRQHFQNVVIDTRLKQCDGLGFIHRRQSALNLCITEPIPQFRDIDPTQTNAVAKCLFQFCRCCGGNEAIFPVQQEDLDQLIENATKFIQLDQGDIRGQSRIECNKFAQVVARSIGTKKFRKLTATTGIPEALSLFQNGQEAVRLFGRRQIFKTTVLQT